MGAAPPKDASDHKDYWPISIFRIGDPYIINLNWKMLLLLGRDHPKNIHEIPKFATERHRKRWHQSCLYPKNHGIPRMVVCRSKRILHALHAKTIQDLFFGGSLMFGYIYVACVCDMFFSYIYDLQCNVDNNKLYIVHNLVHNRVVSHFQGCSFLVVCHESTNK